MFGAHTNRCAFILKTFKYLSKWLLQQQQQKFSEMSTVCLLWRWVQPTFLPFLISETLWLRTTRKKEGTRINGKTVLHLAKQQCGTCPLDYSWIKSRLYYYTYTCVDNGGTDTQSFPAAHLRANALVSTNTVSQHRVTWCRRPRAMISQRTGNPVPKTAG